MIHEAGPAEVAETKENAVRRPATSAGRRCRHRIRPNDTSPSSGSPTRNHISPGSVSRSPAPTTGDPHATRLMSTARP